MPSSRRGHGDNVASMAWNPRHRADETTGTTSRRWRRWNRHAIAQTQLRGQHRVDGVEGQKKRGRRNKTGPAGRTYLWYPTPARRTSTSTGAATSRTSRIELELEVADPANRRRRTNHRARTHRASLIIFDGSCPSGSNCIRRGRTGLFGSLGTPRLFV